MAPVPPASPGTVSVQSQVATPNPTPTAAATSSPTLNDRGAIVKKIGEMAGLKLESNEWTVQFKVTMIEAGYKCPAKYAERSKNGNFIAIHMDVQTTRALGSDKFWTDQWKVIGPDGTTENDSNGNAWGCANEADSLPGMIGAGEHVKGIVVLDSRYTSGAVMLEQPGMDGGWEWGF